MNRHSHCWNGALLGNSWFRWFWVTMETMLQISIYLFPVARRRLLRINMVEG
jgi:hypothetical protein